MSKNPAGIASDMSNIDGSCRLIISTVGFKENLSNENR